MLKLHCLFIFCPFSQFERSSNILDQYKIWFSSMVSKPMNIFTHTTGGAVQQTGLGYLACLQKCTSYIEWINSS
jgi:hypothetical protein